METFFTRFAGLAARAAGRPPTFVACVAIVLVWAISGPIFGFSDTWQLIINTGTTIVTFLMVFLIQNTQNRDGAAMQAKLDELIHASRSADERFVGIEHLTDKQLEKIVEQVEERAARVHGDGRDALPVIRTRREDEKAGNPPGEPPTRKPVRRPAARRTAPARKAAAR